MMLNLLVSCEFSTNTDSANSEKRKFSEANSAQKKLGRSILSENSPNPCSCLKQRWGNIQGCTRPILRASYVAFKILALAGVPLYRLAWEL